MDRSVSKETDNVTESLSFSVCAKEKRTVCRWSTNWLKKQLSFPLAYIAIKVRFSFVNPNYHFHLNILKSKLLVLALHIVGQNRLSHLQLHIIMYDHRKAHLSKSHDAAG